MLAAVSVWQQAAPETAFGGSMTTPDAPIKKMQLERMILLALQRFEQQTGAKVQAITVTGGNVHNNAGEEHHVLTQVRIVVQP
jgi:hypothetical protein